MKSAATLFLFALARPAVAGSSEVASNPVSRIVTLLTGLKEKLEEDMQAEENLFDTYKCWYKTTTTTKTASNEAAKSRADSLKTYIKDIEAGKIEFTTEREDLEKQIGELTSDLEQAKTMRENEKKDYEAAKKEMEQGISALKSATKTIEDATKGSLAQTRSYIDMLSTRHSVQKAMAFSRGLLDASDMKYLERLVSGDVPKADWKKLNRKATFKSKYTKRSGGILKTLKSLQTTFEANLADATAKEKEDQAAYDKLKKSKGDMLDSAKKALTDMAAENGARGQSKTEAQNEVDALEAQIKADTKFISEAEDAFKIKEKEWAGRKELRGKEILAMSQAIAVLASDDAKDQFKDSFKSQGYSFLQTLREPDRRAKCAARVMKSVASKSSDVQLLQLAAVAKNAEIDKVVKKIDEIVALKKKEEGEDLDKKQKCEKDLSKAAADARKAALEMDTATEDITRADAKVEELKGEIKEQEEKKKSMQGQIKDLESQRKDENIQFKNDKLADEKAVALVENAINILKDWKNAKKSALISQQRMTAVAGALREVKSAVSLVQQPQAPSGILPAPADTAPVEKAPHRIAAVSVHTSQDPADYAVDAGKAPPPPPATWDAGAEYGGAKGESAGVLGILALVKEDIKKDIKAAEDEEAESVKDFKKEKADLEDEIKKTDTTIDAYTKDKAAQEKTSTDKTKERAAKNGELESHVKLYNSYKPGCDFLLINFDTRTKARQIEIDGLEKAKAILKGGKFSSSLLQLGC